MRLVYFGTAEFAVPALRAVAKSVALVVSQPDRPSGRGMKLRPTPVKSAALELGLPWETPEKPRAPHFVDRLREINADALLVAAYGQILSIPVLESARRGGINLHGSILPRHRGAAPIQRAILEGDRETGVSLMQMDRGMDTGDVIAIERVAIGHDETYGDLQARLAEVAAEMAAVWLPRIAAGDYPRTPQDPGLATVAPKVSKQEAELRVDRQAILEYRRFRAFTPSPGPFLSTARGPLRVHRARFVAATGNAGAVLATSPLVVAFAEGALELVEVQPAGRPHVSGTDYANGARLRPGDPI